MHIDQTKHKSNPPPTSPRIARVTPTTTPPAGFAPQSAEDDALGEIEHLLVRMLIGTITFPFIRLPHLIFQTIWFLSPTAVRVIRIGGLVLILAIVVLGPGTYAYFFRFANLWLADRIPSWLGAWLTTHPIVARSICFVWTAIAVIGSIWGAIYIRRRRGTKLV